MSAYRTSAGTQAKLAPETAWYRLVWAALRGALWRVRKRRVRLGLLPARRPSTPVDEVFEVTRASALRASAGFENAGSIDHSQCGSECAYKATSSCRPWSSSVIVNPGESPDNVVEQLNQSGVCVFCGKQVSNLLRHTLNSEC